MDAKPFRLQAEYQPAGDQPEAIARLCDGLESGLAHQTLLGSQSPVAQGPRDEEATVQGEQGRTIGAFVACSGPLPKRHDPLELSDAGTDG